MKFLLLIMETDEGHYQPVGEVTESEALDAARDDFRGREPGKDLCPSSYALWERVPGGAYVLNRRFDAWESWEN